MIYNTPLKRMKGLMFSKKKTIVLKWDKPGFYSLHMFFVFYPIWVVAADEHRRVVDVKKLYPFISFYTPPKPVMYILESPWPVRYKVGDLLNF